MSRFMGAAVLLAMAAQCAPPAVASESVGRPTYVISLSWPIGGRSYVPRVALAVSGGAQIPLYEPTPPYQKSSLSCPPEGCSPAFLAVVGTVYAIGTLAVLKAAGKD